jgi:hypothetical protein
MMSILPFDQRDGVHLDERQARALARRQAACAVAWPALRQLRVRGRARLWRRIFKIARAFRAPAIEVGRILDFEIPYSVDEIDAAKKLVLENGLTDAMCARSPGAAAR